MKTHLKNILKQIIHNSGYDIKKLSPSSYYLKSCEEIFCKDPSQFLEIMVHNRKTLSLVDEWISDDTYNNSFWQYGIPRGNKNSI